MSKLWLAALGIPALAAIDIYHFVFARKRPPLLNALLDKKMHLPEYYVWRDKRADALRQQVHLCYTLTSERGETLHGNYFPWGAKFCF